MMPQDNALQPLLLCGGSGTRLWPLSRETYPKQFVDIGLGKSLFQLTLANVGALTSRPPLIVCGEEHRFSVAAQLEGREATVAVEPMARNTTAAIAAACLLNEDPQTVALMMPCDHYYSDIEALSKAVSAAADLARQGRLVQVGIEPTHPSTEYGYIHCGQALGDGFEIVDMKEKPVVELAESFLEKGYVWNSGLLVFTPATLLAEIKRYCPDVYDWVWNAVALAKRCDHQIFLDRDCYAEINPRSLDYEVLERTDRSACVKYAGRWTDLGTWDAVATLHEELGLQAQGSTLIEECEGSFVLGSRRLTCVKGLKDMVVVDTPDALMIVNRKDSKAVKAFVEQLSALDSKTARDPHRVQRPWGWYESLSDGATHQTKRIHVTHGHAISLQYHHYRNEHWVVISGQATVTIGEQTSQIGTGMSVFIPAGVIHRLAAENGDVELIEVQTGTYFGEDDIVRLDDQYGR